LTLNDVESKDFKEGLEDASRAAWRFARWAGTR
jgi:hypothetical protein